MNPDKEEQIRQDAMMDLARESAVTEMKEWFLRHYENPGHRTPYESAEGGYIYIWGGPYDAKEVLFDQFAGEYPDDFIDEAVDDLQRESLEWAKIPTREDLDVGDEPVSEYLARAQLSLRQVRSELAVQDAKEDSFLNALLYAHVISVLEAFLSEAFASKLKDEKIFRRFIETDPKFKDTPISVSEVFKEMEKLQARATEHLQSIVFHRLDVVQQMFKATLGAELPSGLKELFRAVQTRHDIVHRNCRTKNGVEFQITKSQVTELVDLVEKFTVELGEKLEP